MILSCVVPLGIFVGRNNIRAFRREFVRDLERLFSFANLPDGTQLIIPSFELPAAARSGSIRPSS